MQCVTSGRGSPRLRTRCWPPAWGIVPASGPEWAQRLPPAGALGNSPSRDPKADAHPKAPSGAFRWLLPRRGRQLITTNRGDAVGCHGSCARLYGFTSRVLAGGRPHPRPLALGKSETERCGSTAQKGTLRLGSGAGGSLPRPAAPFRGSPSKAG